MCPYLCVESLSVCAIYCKVYMHCSSEFRQLVPKDVARRTRPFGGRSRLGHRDLGGSPRYYNTPTPTPTTPLPPHTHIHTHTLYSVAMVCQGLLSSLWPPMLLYQRCLLEALDWLLLEKYCFSNRKCTCIIYNVWVNEHVMLSQLQYWGPLCYSTRLSTCITILC